MAIYTALSMEDAERVASSHQLGTAREVIGVVAGSVNSNFRLVAERRTVFVRIYEEQEVDGVRYEWALLSHLVRAGLPVPHRVEGPGPGELRVAGKPTAVFELIAGDEVCQAMVTSERAETVGAFLGKAHRAASDFPQDRGGRFTSADVRERVQSIADKKRPELEDAVRTLIEVLDEVDAAWDESLPRGVIHGDLFRDNVRWDDVRWNRPRILGVLDWESASTGLYMYDLAVTILAWCYGDALDAELMTAMRAGYESERAMTTSENEFLRIALMSAAARFTATRITDFHLRVTGSQIKKDWRRFYDRLMAVRSSV